jgi:hypothetical protein
MESAGITADLRTDWAEAIGGVRELVDLAPALPDDCRQNVTARIHKLAGSVIKLSTQLRDACYAVLRLSDADQTAEKINEVLVFANLIGLKMDGMLTAARAQEPSLMSEPDFKAISELAEAFADIAETVALSQSASFKSELEIAKRAAIS